MSIEKNCRTLVLAGGGIYAYTMLGALGQVDKERPLDNFDRLVGSSIGSVLAFLVAIGCPIVEIRQVLDQFTPGLFTFSDMTQLMSTRGCDDAKGFMGVLEAHLVDKGLSTDITFQELYDKFGKDLHVTGVNVEENKSVYFSKVSSGDMRVLTAIRVSIAIPYLFTPVTIGSSTYVDGSMLDNCAIDYAKGLKERKGPILALKVAIPEAGVYKTTTALDLFLSTILALLKKTEDLKDGSIVLPCRKEVSPFDFSLSIDKRDQLFTDGANGYTNRQQ